MTATMAQCSRGGATTTAMPAGSAQAHASDYDGRRRKAALVLALAVVTDLMDATILTVALPAIQRTMHAGATAVHRMAAGYVLTFALLLVTGGRLGDVFGYKRLFLARVAGSCCHPCWSGWRRDGGFTARHPGLVTSRGAIQLRPDDAAGIADEEFLALARAALEP